MVDELLKQEHDFTVDEEMITDPDAVEYAKTKAEAYDRWRKRIKYDLLVLKSDDVEGQEAIDRLRRRYHSFAKRMQQYRSDELLEMFLSSITMGFDPHTTYMSPSSLENFEISMRLKLEGIGAALMMNDGYTVVTKVIPGGAADKDGQLKPEDRIVSVGQGERRRDGRRGRHEAERRGQADSRQRRHDRAAGRQTRGLRMRCRSTRSRGQPSN